MKIFNAYKIPCLAALLVMMCVSGGAALGESISDSLNENFLYFGNYDGAIRFLEQYVDSREDDPEGQLQLGILYMKVGRHTDAVASFEKAAILNPEDGFSQVWLARAKAEMGMYDEAEKLVEKARRMAPDDPRLHVFAAGVLYEMGDIEAAEDIARALVDENSEYSTREGVEVMLLFFAALELDGLDAAAKIIEKATKVKKSPDPCFDVYLADVYIGRGPDYYPVAKNSLERASDECDTCGLVNFRLGYMADMEGDYAGAADFYRKTVENACLDMPAARGGRMAGVFMYYSLFNDGYDAGELLDILDSEEDKYGDSPYYQWLKALVCWYSGSDCAVDSYLKAVPMAPVNFTEGPGAYAVFLPDDYKAMDKIAAAAEKDMDYFELNCNRDANIPEGTFFTSIKAPGMANLYRYVGAGDKEGSCGFVAYASAEEIDPARITEPPFIPIPFSEGSYFIGNVYPTATLFERFWFTPPAVVFPKFAPE